MKSQQTKKTDEKFARQVRKMLRMGYRPEEMLQKNVVYMAQDIKEGRMDYETGKAFLIHMNHIVMDIAKEEGVEVKRIGVFM